MPGRYQVDVNIDTSHNLYHASKLYVGLCGLADRRLIRLRFRRSSRNQDGPPDPLLVCLRVRAAPAGDEKTLCIDLRDRSDVVNEEGLEGSDVYFKRSYYLPHLRALPVALRRKVLPFGLNHACRNWSSTRKVVSTLVPQLVAQLFRSPRRALKHLAANFPMLRQYRTCPHPRRYEQGPDVKLEPAVVFQTRVWEPQEVSPDDADAVNEERVGLVRALRKAFGTRFHGGVWPTPFAQSRYPDALATCGTRRSVYLPMSQRCLVGVYTRGLHYSTAFKLSEYLAASQCIVASGLRNETPRPLRDGTNYLAFTTSEECVERCTRFFEDGPLAAHVRRENQQYYAEEVDPPAQVLNCLDRAFDTLPGPADRAEAPAAALV
jgi:hypothetical protein